MKDDRETKVLGTMGWVICLACGFTLRFFYKSIPEGINYLLFLGIIVFGIIGYIFSRDDKGVDKDE